MIIPDRARVLRSCHLSTNAHVPRWTSATAPAHRRRVVGSRAQPLCEPPGLGITMSPTGTTVTPVRDTVGEPGIEMKSTSALSSCSAVPGR